MPQFKLDATQVRVADPSAPNLYAVVIKGSYGWLRDGDSLAMIQANNEEQAVRHAAAEVLENTGKHIPLGPEHVWPILIASKKS